MYELLVEPGTRLAAPPTVPVPAQEQADVPARVRESLAPVLRTILEQELIRRMGEERRWSHEQVVSVAKRTGAEVVELLGAAVGANTIVDGTDEAGRRALAARENAVRKSLLPLFVSPATPAADGHDTSYTPLTLRLSLKSGAVVARFLDDLAGALAAYGADLVDRGFLGFVIYAEGDIAAYSYVLRRICDVSVTNSQDLGRGIIAEDMSAPHGQRITYEEREQRWGSATYRTEKHVHHLQNARAEALRTFAGAMPERAWTLMRVFPEWLSSHLQVLQGTIVQEEVYEQDQKTDTWALPVVRRVYTLSPAICLGSLVLTGWSSSDPVLVSAPVLTQIPTRSGGSSAQATRGGWGVAPVVAGALVTTLIPGGWAVRIGLGVLTTLGWALFRRR